MIDSLMKPGAKRILIGRYRLGIDVLSVLTALYLMTAVVTYPEPLLLRSISLGLFFAIIFITYTSPGSKSVHSVPFYDLLLGAASLSVSMYIAANLDRLVDRLVFVDPVYGPDLFFGVMTMLLLLEGTRRVVGPWLPALSMLAMVYILYGHLLTGRFGHRGFTAAYIVDGLFLSSYGVFGSILGTASSQIMIFLIFGSFFVMSGAGDFLFDFVSTFAGKSRGGVAKIAVISSALFGMVSGGPISNVTTTGALTIPAMKKSGYSPEFAAATESCASVGGVLMPPIMGSVAFIMADIIGMPYGMVARKAFLPAVVYFAALFFVIDIRSRKLGIDGFLGSDKKKLIPLLLKGSGFFVPLVYMVYRLMAGITAPRVGLESVVVILLTTFVSGRKHFSLKKICRALIAAVERGAMIIATMATCGILVGVIHITGITLKFSSYLMSLTGYSVVLTLVLVMGITLFLGLAMNMTSAYLITAVICAPILIQSGFDPFGVHLFILFYATMATITPPVALTSFAAAAIAGASPMRVGFMSMRMALVAYILPYVFVFNPALLMEGTGLNIGFAFLSAVGGVWALSMGMEGWWFAKKMNLLHRIWIIAAGIFAVTGVWQFTVLGVLIISIGCLVDWLTCGREENTAMADPTEQS